MAGRGRGRGRGMSFSVETLGFAKGESLPGPLLQPPPLFPPLDYKPVPLEAGEEWDYILALKQEFRGSMKDSPYYIKSADKKRDIERYSDKYQLGQQDALNFQPDWSRLPKELRVKPRKRVRVKMAGVQPKLPGSLATEGQIDVTKTLKVLEEKEGQQEVDDEETEEKEGDKGSENEEEAEEYYEEEDMEEETDYNLTYFDGGENYGADEDDDLDDGPIY